MFYNIQHSASLSKWSQQSSVTDLCFSETIMTKTLDCLHLQRDETIIPACGYIHRPYDEHDWQVWLYYIFKSVIQMGK